ncbi:MAG: isoprenylcysteine carboxylmethyltransferase family protein [Candidatus Solibacter sp.]
MRFTDAKRLVAACFSLTIMAICLFGSAGRLDWSNAWVLLGLSFAAGVAFTVGCDPELAAERRKVKAGKSWDKVLVGITVLLGPMAVWITAGLDHRFQWSHGVSSSAFPAGLTAAVLAAALITWAMRSNRFFSAVVRIQKDRGHTVVDGGPYRFIRHPGYTGMSVFTLVTPFILGSYWALVPAAATASVIVLRTIMEDATLHSELDGYADYAHRVRHRLLPAIW